MFQRLIAAKNKKSPAKDKTDHEDDSVYCEINLLPSRYSITKSYLQARNYFISGRTISACSGWQGFLAELRKQMSYPGQYFKIITQILILTIFQSIVPHSLCLIQPDVLVLLFNKGRRVESDDGVSQVIIVCTVISSLDEIYLHYKEMLNLKTINIYQLIKY